MDISIHASFLPTTFARPQASSGEVGQEPAEQPYGGRGCAVHDPAGNLIRIRELHLAVRQFQA